MQVKRKHVRPNHSFCTMSQTVRAFYDRNIDQEWGRLDLPLQRIEAAGREQVLALLGYTPAFAQSNGILDLLYESPPGTSVLGKTGVDTTVGRYVIDNLQDANGDGRPDLILERRDEQGYLQAVRVLDGSTQETIWEVLDVQTRFTDGTADRDLTLHGFVHLIAPIPAFALFSSSEDVFLVDLDDNSEAFRTLAPGPSVLLGVRDVTGDGLVGLIICLPEEETVQVYGRSTPE